MLATVGLLLGALGTTPPPPAMNAEAGAVGGPGLAMRAAKVLTCVFDGPQVIDHGIVLVRDGKIEAVGSAREIDVPNGYELLDVGSRWLTPGLIDLHSHQAGVDFFRGGGTDLNDTVYLANPGQRASTAVRPGEPIMKMGVAGGVTSVLFIPGSGSNIGGQGILLKTGFDTYAENLIRNPGSMKLAQWGNPESWGPGVGMSFENWNTRHTIRRGLAYARRWAAFEAGEGPEPARNIQFDLFRDLLAREIGVATHTQMYQVVLMTITMIARDFDLPVYLDHSTIGGWLTGDLAAKYGVPAIVGPRSLDTTARRMLDWARNKHEGMRGVTAGYQQRGLDMIGFNTDAPIIPQEELLVNATMGVRYGLDDARMASVRGLTIIPAMAARMDDQVGSLEPGKDADILVASGVPTDPRTAFDIVFIDGRRVYDAERDGRRW